MPLAASYLGALWFRELVRMASEERPEAPVSALLDYGEDEAAFEGQIRRVVPERHRRATKRKKVEERPG